MEAAHPFEAAHQYNVHEARTHFSRILAQVSAGEEVVISKGGEPVAKVVPLRGSPRTSATCRTTSLTPWA